jgi:hypothetical protein
MVLMGRRTSHSAQGTGSTNPRMPKPFHPVSQKAIRGQRRCKTNPLGEGHRPGNPPQESCAPPGLDLPNALQPTADAVGYHLPVLRTSCPAASGPEGRKTVAHGVSRGWTWVVDSQPQRGDRTHASRKLATSKRWHKPIPPRHRIWRTPVSTGCPGWSRTPPCLRGILQTLLRRTAPRPPAPTGRTMIAQGKSRACEGRRPG